MIQDDPQLEQTRRDWRDLRTNFYRAGRSLWTTGQMEIGALTFGYAIEMSLKRLLFETRRNTTKALQNSHDLVALTEHAVQSGLIPAGRLSADFLDFANVAFGARYPRWITEGRETTERRGHVYHFDITYLSTYDDAILALEDAVIAASGENQSSSILCSAANHLISEQFQVFTGNHAIIPRIERISNLVAREFLTMSNRLQVILDTAQQEDRKAAIRQQRVSLHSQQSDVQKHLRLLPKWILDPTDERVRVVVTNGPTASSFKNTSRVIRDREGYIVGASVGLESGPGRARRPAR